MGDINVLHYKNIKDACNPKKKKGYKKLYIELEADFGEKKVDARTDPQTVEDLAHVFWETNI